MIKMTQQELRCKDRIDGSWKYTKSQIKELLEAENYQGLEEFGYGFDYVSSNTFEDQEEPYYRWILSGGGPSSEIRFYEKEKICHNEIEYVFMDWFDGAIKDISIDEIGILIRGYFDGSIIFPNKEEEREY